MSMGRPRVRLSTKEAKVGDLVEVRTVINHVMETGQRRLTSGEIVPRKIINRLTCTVAGATVFTALLEPGLSANPFIQFKFRATTSGPVVLTWTDDDGATVVHEDAITVS